MRLLRPTPRYARAALLAVLAVVSLLCASAAPAAATPRGATAATELGPLGAPVSAAPARRAPGRGPRARAAAGPSVTRALSSLLSAGQISEATYRNDYAIYTAAKRSLGQLSGTRRAELGAVLANTQAIAAAGQLTASRQAIVFLTLEKNRYWWTTKPLLSGTVRVSFPPSKIVWQRYPGQGIQIQWLGTFGAGNGFYSSGHENSNLRQLVDEVIPLATKRAGGLAWEYMFRFDGGAPPWTSGLSQGTGLQMLARAGQRFKEPAYTAAAKEALGIFQQPPPNGVRVPTKAGAWYAQYTYAPSDRIINGFIQSLVGLYDYAAITKDPLGLKLFEAGDAEARLAAPRFDTGAWSLYDQYGESDLSYHELLTEFLQHLCERTRKGPPTTPAAPPPVPPPTTTTPPATTTPVTPGGGTSASASARAAATQIAGDDVYCATAKRFTAYETTPPTVALLTRSLRGGTRAGVQVSLSKISTVTIKVLKGSRLVWSNSATVRAGKPRLLWATPSAGGTFTVSVAARDLAGNFSTTSGMVAVSRH
ncbi:MAG TPA: D-glucuronyl C5-epimerase family protein [Solirubrobacteraceae bacterium]